MNRPPKPLKGPYRLYWSDYGGWKAIRSSSYLYWALAILVFCLPEWWKGGWWDTVISTVPSLMGFSLAAFAMLLAFGNERFIKKVLAPCKAGSEEVSAGIKAPETVPPPRIPIYTQTAAAFFHFIIIQTLSLMTALVARAMYIPVPHWVRHALEVTGVPLDWFINATRLLWPVGYLLFLYGIAVGLAATAWIYTLARWYVTFLSKDEEPKT